MNEILLLHVKHDTPPRLPRLIAVLGSHVHRVTEIGTHECLEDVIFRLVGNDTKQTCQVCTPRAVLLACSYDAPRAAIS